MVALCYSNRTSLSLQACPMNMRLHADPSKTPQEIWEDFSLSFTPSVREVVEFAKHIPGFRALSQSDQVTLLKAGTFEVRLPRAAKLTCNATHRCLKSLQFRFTARHSDIYWKQKLQILLQVSGNTPQYPATVLSLRGNQKML